jgi:putative flavoprotein involved in K+ transport
LRPGSALVVGAGNSGAEIALELAPEHETLLAGRHTGHIPIMLGGLGYRVLSLLPLGLWPGSALAKMLAGGGHPLVRVAPEDLARVGVKRAPRVVSARDGRPVLADGRALDVSNVVWCTGFLPDFSWIDLPAFAANATPVHRRGIALSEPGLYFVGLPLQSSLASGLVGGVGADARYVSRQLARRPRAETSV